MAQVDNIRNGLIEKLLTISNLGYLKALNELVANSKLEKNKIDLTDEQVLMLKLSDTDIKNDRLISQNQFDKEDLLLLKGQYFGLKKYLDSLKAMRKANE